MNRKSKLYVILFVFAVFLSSCGEKPPIIDYSPTISALETQVARNIVVLSTKETELESMMYENESLDEALTAEKEIVSTLAASEAELSDQLLEKNDDGEALRAMVQEYHDLFMAVQGDKQGEYVFCTYAFERTFAYIDKVSMRTELAQYVASVMGINADSIQTQHQMIWGNTDDGLIKVFAGGYMYPFIVRFEDAEFGTEDSVYSLASGCFVDYPALEENFLSVEGN
ncbi:MAG: hypothetical protein HPY85_06775 [Anaerolineae bacterium]|nr:hypothetical protein [Anaerolineae bacterium]